MAPRAVRIGSLVLLAAGLAWFVGRAPAPPAAMPPFQPRVVYREPASAAVEAAIGAASSGSTPPFELRVVERDARGLATAVGQVHCGPTNGMVFGYVGGFVVAPHGEWTARWPSHADRGDLLFGAGLLRRVRLHAGRRTEVVLGQPLALQPPSLSTPLKPQEDHGPHVTTFGARVAPGAPFLAIHRVGEPVLGHRDRMARRKHVVLVGRVTAPDGTPARDFMVRRALPDSYDIAERRDGGFYVLLLERSGTYELEAADADGAYARGTVTVPAAGAILDLQLVARPVVRGRVVGADGSPRVGIRLLWWTDDGDYANHVTSQVDGSFVVLARTAGTGALWACAPGEGARWPVAGGTAHTDAPELRIVVDDAPCRGSVAVWVAHPVGLPPDSVCARLWQVATGLGRELYCTASIEQGSQLVAEDLPEGRYELELFTPAHGVVACGTFVSDGRNAAALPQPPTLPPLCAIVVERTGGTEPFAFDLVRAEGASHSWIHTDAPLRGPHHLGAGDYELWWRDGDENAPARSHAFAVAPGATELVVRLP